MKYLKGLLYTLIVSNFVGQTFTNFTSADGLVDDNVTCGTYQGNGILWFGTQNGISKFDGVNWTNFTTLFELNLSLDDRYDTSDKVRLYLKNMFSNLPTNEKRS